MNGLEKKYPLIPMSEIDEEARRIAVAWVEDYEPNGFDLPNKHKLASDIHNFAINWQKEKSYSESEVLQLLLNAKLANYNSLYDWFNEHKKK